MSNIVMGGILVALVGATTLAWVAFGALVVVELVLVPAYRNGIRLQAEKPPSP